MWKRKTLQEKISEALPPLKTGYAWKIEPSLTRPEEIFILKLVKIDVEANNEDMVVTEIENEHFWNLKHRGLRETALTVLRKANVHTGKAYGIDELQSQNNNPAFGFYVSQRTIVESKRASEM